jgi:hypothetical protein
MVYAILVWGKNREDGVRIYGDRIYGVGEEQGGWCTQFWCGLKTGRIGGVRIYGV